MSDDGASTWPEQDAVDAWLTENGINVSRAASMTLKTAVTEFRIAHQRRANASYASGLERAKQAIASLPRGLSDEYTNGQEDAYRAIEALSPVPPLQAAMQVPEVRALVKAIARGPGLGQDMRRWNETVMKQAAALFALPADDKGGEG
jgi:hypothetical protein